MNQDAKLDPGPVRFGESFELDLTRQQLARYGQPVRLERIPLTILMVLVERRTEIVSREEIVARVWGEGTYLDTDNAINGAIRKIRQVLKDDPEQPKYIQTITGKGYRFIADVQLRGGGETSSPGDQTAPRQIWTRPRLALGALALIAVVAFAIYLSTAQFGPAAEPPAGKYMLAVLPFENLTGDPNEEYFSDGLTEEMITHLGNLDPDHLGIIARTSVMQYKNNRDGLSRVGRELGVHYTLEGSVRREAGKVRISAQLIQMKDQTQVWARQYDRDVKSLLQLQNEIANEVAEEIQLTLAKKRGPSETLDTRTLSPQEYAAYDSYLRGRYFWNKRTPEGFQQAIKAFEEAIYSDPNYARAYVGLADTYALISGYDLAPKNEAIPKAREAVAKALALDDSLAEAHASMAVIAQNYDWNWQKAEAEYKRAISLDPNYATARHWYAEFLTIQGRFPEALDEMERARELDPRSLIIAADKGATFYCDHRYDQAVQQLQGVLQMEPDFPRAHIIVFAYAGLGKNNEALRDITELQKQRDDPFTWMLFAYAHGRAGHKAEALAYLRKLEAERSRRYVDSAKLVMAYLGTGNNQRALDWLEKALAERSTAMVWLKVDPAYDPLRSDPRFQTLLRKVGFE